ncbi:MAG: hypothetical protein V3V04_02485 [Rhizobiaceae bacterium]
MTRFFLALLRITALALSFALSSLSAAAFITFVLFLGSDAGWLQTDPFVTIGAFTFMIAMWFSIAQYAFYPAIAAFFVLEFARLNSLISNLLAGGFCALATLLLMPEFLTEEALPYPSKNVWAALLAAGFIAGFTHWVLAGHRSGRWLGPQNQEPIGSTHSDAH